MKLAIFATHPIQYQVPWFRALAARPGVELKVYYALLPDARQQGVGFGVPFAWDIPMLEGYDYEVLPNRGRTPGLRGFAANSTPDVRRVLAANRPDVAILTGWHARPLLQALLACVRLGIPRVMRGESNAIRPRPRWTRPLHRLLLGRMDAFLAIGRSNREFYLRSGVPADRIFACPYFVDNGRFRRQRMERAAERPALRERWGIPPGAACFLFAGKLEPKKRIMDLLRALEAVGARAPAIHLLVVGTGELLAEARSFAAERSLPVSFAGFLNQTGISDAYVAADCLVLPSDHGETWGLVVNEAMASGLPAIVSDRVGCGPDLVLEGETGSVFPFGDVYALAGRMSALAADPARLARMGERAAGHVEAYSLERAVDGTLRAAAAAAPGGEARP